MTDQPDSATLFTQMLRVQGEAASQALAALFPATPDAASPVAQMGTALQQMQQSWLALLGQAPAGGGSVSPFADPAAWLEAMQALAAANPLLDPARQAEIWAEGMALWQQILNRFDGEGAAPGGAELPRADRRFADPHWRDQPVFALIHQTYLLLAERIGEAVDSASGLEEGEREQLRFATRAVLDAMSPANFPLLNPVVLERTLETRGENLLKGMERLAGDLERGQLTHTDTSHFVVGETVAATPGKVIYRSELFELIHYTPTTPEVLETPLLIFPPWINRFYILDLSPKKSFIKWAVDQGISVVVASWRSADESLAHVGRDAYVKAQLEAIDVVRERLAVPAVHTIGYCVAGTTLAMTLAVLARRGEGGKVASATFLTAQVDFAHAGELRLFVDEGRLEFIRRASQGGFFDGRYMAATFNLLRGPDLIWNYVVNHYLLGQEYPAFDLLFWNGDVTNLPAGWHEAYLIECYRDNLLVVPDALEADGTKIDLGLIETPAYVQAGREDHIAPPLSVFEITRHLSGPVRFVLAGSGHIAGVVNPPSAGKYQYWTGPDGADSLDAFTAAATEHKGSWWPDWAAWIESHDSRRVKASGRRVPGGRGNPALEDAPGTYVKLR